MMNRWLAGFAVILTGVCAAQAQTNKGTSTEEALINLENRWVAALVKADTASLDAIFAATYVDTDEGGGRTDKAGLLAVLKSGQLKMTSIKLSDVHVYPYGNFAVVTGAAAQAGTFEGRSVAPKIVFTDSFLLQNGTWRAVASQRTTAPRRVTRGMTPLVIPSIQKPSDGLLPQ